MATLDMQNQTCISSLKLLGDYWTLRIIDALSEGPLRYCELQRRSDNVNPVTLSGRLKKLEDAQLIARHEESRAEVAYQLTPLGKEILPVLAAINTFAAKAKKAHS